MLTWILLAFVTSFLFVVVSLMPMLVNRKTDKPKMAQNVEREMNITNVRITIRLPDASFDLIDAMPQME